MTKGGNDALIAIAENTSNIIEPPTDAEMSSAITSSISSLLTVVCYLRCIPFVQRLIRIQARAVKKFKRLLKSKRFEPTGGMLSTTLESLQPQTPDVPSGETVNCHGALRKAMSYNAHDRQSPEMALVVGGIHRVVNAEMSTSAYTVKTNPGSSVSGKKSDDGTDPGVSTVRMKSDEHSGPRIDHESRKLACEKASHQDGVSQGNLNDGSRHGHTRDAMHDEAPFLGIGFGGSIPEESSHAVSESPKPTDEDLYEKAYENEVNRITDQSTCPVPIFSTWYIDRANSRKPT